jgi:hypothetical protein
LREHAPDLPFPYPDEVMAGHRLFEAIVHLVEA